MRSYAVEFEIEGPAAMFARPDTGAVPISYPAPTWSACKAMFESVARGMVRDRWQEGKGIEPGAFFCPAAVEILRPIRFEKYVTNYRGPLRKTQQISDGDSYQLPATILVDVCYRVTAVCLEIPGVPGANRNAPHALQEMFRRRLGQGKSKYAPSLGWKEFLPTYFGPPRAHPESHSEAPRLQVDLNMSLPAFLLTVWDSPTKGSYSPVLRELSVAGGRLEFPMPRVEGGKLVFPESKHAD